MVTKIPRFAFEKSYPFEVIGFNVTSLVRGFHASEFENPFDSPFDFATKHGLPMNSLDEFLTVLDRLFLEAKDKGAVCLKSTLAIGVLEGGVELWDVAAGRRMRTLELLQDTTPALARTLALAISAEKLFSRYPPQANCTRRL